MPPKKICLISFDQWDYDHYIIKALESKGIEAHHINISKFKYRYPTVFHRISNFISKTIFKKNIKKIRRQQHILEQLEKIGHQDKILVINPEMVNPETHKRITEFTNEYIAYLYDSCDRYPVAHLFDFFDEIYSFDEKDVAKYNLKPLSNYIYFDQKPLQKRSQIKHTVFMIATIDERYHLLNKISYLLDDLQIDYKFILIGSKKPNGLNPKIEFQRKRVSLHDIEVYLSESAVFLDLIRINQIGLSFRVFESLGFQKKLLTTNASVKNYSFYNPANIAILDPENLSVDPDFFKTPYEPLAEAIYHNYTIEHWVDIVFKL